MHFPGGSSFYLGGAAFQRGRYWGVCRSGWQFLAISEAPLTVITVLRSWP